MLGYIFKAESSVWYGKLQVVHLNAYDFFFCVSNLFRKLVVRLWLIATVHHWLTDGFETQPEVQLVSGCKMSMETTVGNLWFHSDVDVVWSLLDMALCWVSQSVRHVSKARGRSDDMASPTADIGLNWSIWLSKQTWLHQDCQPQSKENRQAYWLTDTKEQSFWHLYV
jgi:hypothetical protein